MLLLRPHAKVFRQSDTPTSLYVCMRLRGLNLRQSGSGEYHALALDAREAVLLRATSALNLSMRGTRSVSSQLVHNNGFLHLSTIHTQSAHTASHATHAPSWSSSSVLAPQVNSPPRSRPPRPHSRRTHRTARRRAGCRRRSVAVPGRSSLRRHPPAGGRRVHGSVVAMIRCAQLCQRRPQSSSSTRVLVRLHT